MGTLNFHQKISALRLNTKICILMTSYAEHKKNLLYAIHLLYCSEAIEFIVLCCPLFSSKIAMSTVRYFDLAWWK
jgi:hypothetical protein